MFFQVAPKAGGREKVIVCAQAVTTAPETEAEADTTEETTVPETTEDAPAPTLKPKKLTKRPKHIMEVGSAKPSLRNLILRFKENAHDLPIYTSIHTRSSCIIIELSHVATPCGIRIDVRKEDRLVYLISLN